MSFYFVQLADCAEDVAFLRGRKIVAKIGRVRDKGQGTVLAPSDGWFEVASDLPTVNDVRRELHKLGAVVREVRDISRGEGKLQAKQLSLFQGGLL